MSLRRTRPRRSVANVDRDPEPHEPREIFRRRIGNVVRCPKCGDYFQSMRAWHFACAQCGHAWQEIAPRSRAQRLADWLGELGSRVGMWLFVAAFVAALFVFWVLLIYARFFMH